jgi:sulfate/thiosulfate-binding protein
MLLLLSIACSPAPEGGERVLTFGAYTAPREVYEEVILPAFARSWEARTGERLTVAASYQASGALTRAVQAGLSADVVALALAPDVDALVKAGLVEPSWREAGEEGVVAQSLVALAVRPGNPKGLRDWEDLTRPDVDVLTPNPRTSGGALWNLAALWGAGLRSPNLAAAGAGEGSARGPSLRAEALVTGVLARVRVMDAGARESLLAFERGVGDVAITYASEIALAQRHGRSMEMVLPSVTLRVDAPAAVVRGNAEKSGNLEAARALVAFLHGQEAREAFASYGFGVPETLSAAGQPPVEVFSMEDLGGWSQVRKDLLGEGGVVERALARRQP